MIYCGEERVSSGILCNLQTRKLKCKARLCNIWVQEENKLCYLQVESWITDHCVMIHFNVLGLSFVKYKMCKLSKI